MNNALETLKNELVKSWNASDIALRNDYSTFCKEHACERFDIGLGYKVTCSGYYYHKHNLSRRDIVMIHRTIEDVKARNEKDAVEFCENLEERVKKITGTIKSWTHSQTDQSNYSYLVIGETGKAKVSQIFAGGYNIVRLHVRNLVKAVK